MAEMTRHVQLKPGRSGPPRQRRVEARDGDQEYASRPQEARRLVEGDPRLLEMFQHMPEDDSVQRTRCQLELRDRHRAHVQSMRFAREPGRALIQLGPHDGPPARAELLKERAAAASDLENVARATACFLEPAGSRRRE